MKIAYNHIISNIKSNPGIEEISSKLFQLGHEHEIQDKIFDIEITPNRGDCLSLNGILRDLSIFYEVNIDKESVRAEALEWSMTRGSRSGRVAYQYIQDLAGRLGTNID